MQPQSELDHFFRQRLYDAEAPPPAFVWDNVERALRRRRRRFFLWLFAAGLLGSGLLATWFWTRPPQPGLQTTRLGKTAPAETSSPGPTAVLPAENPSATGAAAATPLPSPEQPALQAREPRSRTARTAHLNAPVILPRPVVAPPVAPAGNPFSENISVETPAATPPLAAQNQRFASLLALPAHYTPRFGRPDFPENHFKIPPARKRKPKKKNCYDFEKQASVWLLDAYAGPSLARKTLRADEDNLPYLNRRLATEHGDWFAYNAGLRASWLFNRNFLLRAGVHYEQFTEVFEFIDPNSVTVTVEYRTEVVNGVPVTIADTVGVDFGENYVKTYNRFGLLDIPVAAGVELRRGNAGLNLNAGASLNLLFWKRGDIIAPGADVPVAFTPGQNGLEVFRPRVGLSLSGSVQFFYHLRPRLRVFAEPYYRHVLQPVNQVGHPVEQRYNIVGIRLGMTKIVD